jgi:hypothetical protein
VSRKKKRLYEFYHNLKKYGLTILRVKLDGKYSRRDLFEVVSKPQIRFKGKASVRSGKRSIHEYVSIYRRPATQPLGLRWDFETTSNMLIISVKKQLKMLWEQPLF